MPKSILIVEDSEIVSMHLQKVLQRANYNVLAKLISGEDAINFIKTQTPSLIIMDVMIEGKYDGIETSIEINKIKDIPVIYLTALNDKKTIDRAKLTFPNTFLSKPFSESELLSNVELSLFKHQADQEKKGSQKLLSTILDNIKSCVIVVDAEFKIRYLNKFTADLLNTLSEIILEFKLGDDIKISNLDDEPLSISLLKDNNQETVATQEIIYINFVGRKFPINNINITRAKFFNNEQEQYLIMFNDAKESLEKLQKEKKEKRLKLAAQIEGAESERARVSRELHDGLGQMLNVVKMNTRSLVEDNSVKEKLVKLIDASIDESHKISENLMPSKLQIFDLKSSLEDLFYNYESSNFKIDFTTNIKDGELEEIKINIYRIVQEALNNIQKHAKAKNVSVQLYLKKNVIRLSVEDDGVGFDLKTAKTETGKNNSHGLLNMIDRVKSMGGTIDIDSNTKFGTNIIININSKNYA
ncbi:response regulator [Marivirga salinae]|uniref:Response regulator n=1 Tax=Marivirga salinarum TaxID=3059078 RepID=A0AA51NAG3_9BACT|nr:response regulator [Marivirga sp. BDSF4-3]WMN11533.1 response regulator [Marivirga sp. BDSF4-3]